MWNFLCGRLEKYPESLFFDDQHQYTYKDFTEKAKAVGACLQEKCAAKSKCAVLCDRGLNTALAILACWCANMIPIPMSKHYGRKHCANIIALTLPDILLTDTNDCDLFPFQYNIRNGKFIGEKPETSCDENLEDIAVILCTSGTTGTPKGVLITEDGLQKNVQKIAQYFAVDSHDKIMIARPLYHCAVLTGEFLIAIFNGLDIGFFDDKFHPQHTLQFAARHNISVICGTPTLLHHLTVFLERNVAVHFIKTIAISGECLSEKTALHIRKGFPKADIYHVYGLTEASPRVSYLPPKAFDAHPTSVGVPLEGIQVKIIDEDGTPLPANAHGHVFVNTPCLMRGYYKNKEATQKAIVDGWLNTGDLGYLDENGYLYILSRADDMIIKSGMNIYPGEVEAQATELLQIRECVVYKIQANVGQAIAMDVILNPDYKETTKKELMALLATVLPAYQMPSELNIVDALRRNASGKIVRTGRAQ